MTLRVRRGSTELLVSGAEELVRLYRERRVGPTDLVWHPVRGGWMRIEAFLFIDVRSSDGASGSSPS